MPDRIRNLAKRIAETRPVQSRRRHELFEELRALRGELEASGQTDQLYTLDAALLLMEFMSRSEDVATAETIHVVAGLVATLEERHVQPEANPAVRHPLRKVDADVSEHADLRMTQSFLLGTILFQAGVISQDTLARALQLHTSSHQPLGQCFVQLGAASREQVESALAYQDRLRDNERTPQPPRPSSRSDLRLSPKQQEYVQLMNAQVLGEVLIRLGSITREHLAQALTVQRAANLHIGEALVETGAATWDQVKRGLEVQRQLRRSAA